MGIYINQSLIKKNIYNVKFDCDDILTYLLNFFYIL